jgi:hypothetical protein
MAIVVSEDVIRQVKQDVRGGININEKLEKFRNDPEKSNEITSSKSWIKPTKASKAGSAL